MQRSALYRTIWRWHFYAGLFVIPFIVVLAVTGAIYLFKPDIDRWEERAYQGLATASTVSAERQRDTALASHPGSQFQSYRLPQYSGDAAVIKLRLSQTDGVRDVFVAPDGRVLGSLDPEQSLMALVRRIHGQLLLGVKGSWLVELVASWTIVMIVSGLFLWWPVGLRFAGVIWPRLRNGNRVFWRDLHAVTGFWVAGLALILLLTGLPWTSVWGSAFRSIRVHMGWTNNAPQWTIGGEVPKHAQHSPMKSPVVLGGNSFGTSNASLQEIVAKAKGEMLAFPALVWAPGISIPFAQPSATSWTVRSETQVKPLSVTIRYDAVTGAEQSREKFSDQHLIDRVIGYGVAWHEGQLFGRINQLIGVVTAVMLVTLAASGFFMWRQRKPETVLGAPHQSSVPVRFGYVGVAILILAALLPLFAASLVVLFLFDHILLPRIPSFARWLGVSR